MSKELFENPNIRVKFRQDLRRSVVEMAESRSVRGRSGFSFQNFLSIGLVSALLLLVVFAGPVFDRRDDGLLHGLVEIDDALAQVEERLSDETTAITMGVSADQVDAELQAYIAKLQRIVALLEQLVAKLELAGKDTVMAQEKLIQAKLKLAEAESKATYPKDCFAQAASATMQDCEQPIAEAKGSLGDVVGLLRTSVDTAKESL